MAWLTRVNRGGGQLNLPPTPPLTDVLILFSDVNGSRRSKKSDAETATLVEAEVDEAIATCGGCARSFARDPDRERVSGGRNRTIEPSNLDGLRAGADAQGTSAGRENLEVT
jgi:hypothetical protein